MRDGYTWGQKANMTGTEVIQDASRGTSGGYPHGQMLKAMVAGFVKPVTCCGTSSEVSTIPSGNPGARLCRQPLFAEVRSNHRSAIGSGHEPMFAQQVASLDGIGQAGPERSSESNVVLTIKKMMLAFRDWLRCFGQFLRDGRRKQKQKTESDKILGSHGEPPMFVLVSVVQALPTPERRVQPESSHVSLSLQSNLLVTSGGKN